MDAKEFFGDLLRGGLPAVLDLPTEGQTPSYVGGPRAPTGTERTAPIYPYAPAGGALPPASAVPTWVWMAGAAVAAVLVFALVRR